MCSIVGASSYQLSSKHIRIPQSSGFFPVTRYLNEFVMKHWANAYHSFWVKQELRQWEPSFSFFSSLQTPFITLSTRSTDPFASAKHRTSSSCGFSKRFLESYKHCDWWNGKRKYFRHSWNAIAKTSQTKRKHRPVPLQLRYMVSLRKGIPRSL